MVKNAVDVIYGGLSYWLYGFAFSFGVAEGTNGFTGIGEMMETFWWLCVFDWSCWGKKNKIKEMIISKLLTCLNAWMLECLTNYLLLLIILVPKHEISSTSHWQLFLQKTYSINYLIVSETKSSIGSPWVSLSHHDRTFNKILDRDWFVMLLDRDNVKVQLQVSNYNFRTSIMSSSMGSISVNASYSCFLLTYGKGYWLFHSEAAYRYTTLDMIAKNR